MALSGFGGGRRGASAEPLPAGQLRIKAIALLARREHTSAELRTKLKRYGSDAAVVEQVLAALRAENLLSDRRAAQGIARVRGARHGALRVAGELRAKGISGELAAETLAGLRATEEERARQLWERKFGAPATDAAGRARQMRFLQARGFAPDLIRRLVPPASAAMETQDDA